MWGYQLETLLTGRKGGFQVNIPRQPSAGVKRYAGETEMVTERYRYGWLHVLCCMTGLSMCFLLCDLLSVSCGVMSF